jgi:hypothetical protein
VRDAACTVQADQKLHERCPLGASMFHTSIDSHERTTKHFCRRLSTVTKVQQKKGKMCLTRVPAGEAFDALEPCTAKVEAIRPWNAPAQTNLHSTEC